MTNEDGSLSFDPSDLLVVITGGRLELNAVESKNIQKAVVTHLNWLDFHTTLPDFDLAYLREIHRDMFCEVWKWAGSYRTNDLNIGIPWQHIESQMYDLTQRLPYWESMPLIEQCARLHYELVHIHPFTDGNGRWSRLASDIWSTRAGGAICDWPVDLLRTESPVRSEYVAAIKQAEEKGNIKPLIALHKTYQSRK